MGVPAPLPALSRLGFQNQTNSFSSGVPAFTQNTQMRTRFLALNMIFLYLTGYNTAKEITVFTRV